MAGRFRGYADFRPLYSRAHGRPLTRALPCLGTAVALVLLGASLVTADRRLAAGALVIGCLLVWTSQTSVERNRPATFKYPLFAPASDIRMFALAHVRARPCSRAPRPGASMERSRNTGSSGPEARGRLRRRREKHGIGPA